MQLVTVREGLCGKSLFKEQKLFILTCFESFIYLRESI